MEDKTRWQAICDHIQKDEFANYLGAKVEILQPGQSRVSLMVKDHMTNFHGRNEHGPGPCPGEKCRGQPEQCVPCQ